MGHCEGVKLPKIYGNYIGPTKNFEFKALLPYLTDSGNMPGVGHLNDIEMIIILIFTIIFSRLEIQRSSCSVVRSLNFEVEQKACS